MTSRCSITTILLLLISIIAVSVSVIAKNDVDCLRGFKSSISDPDGALSSWNFDNATADFVCGFNGVTCWTNQQNRVLSITLTSSSISGQIPSSLQYCTSINSVTLSSNSLSGPIPKSLCQWLPYIVTLDLSSNSLTGTIPPDISECKYLNNLLLNSNQLSGSIPSTLASLDRLKNLNLSSNRLSGTIPPDLSRFGAASFEDNLSSLCGTPLRSCNEELTMASLVIILAAGVLGAVVSFSLASFIWRSYFSVKKKKAKAKAKTEPKGGREDARWWLNWHRTSHNRIIPVSVSLFQKPIVKLKLADIMTATRNFHPDFIIVSGDSRIGNSYEAVLRDGSVLTVKRLHGFPPLPENLFRAETGRMGQLRHPNLVPLLGFCVVQEERLLIYKHMKHGAFSSVLDELDWPGRLRIGIGTARGLAWLHHGFHVPFLHQNLSSAAVLLDEDYEPRITDFGLAGLGRDFVLTKCDVYSFGVILLELVTGQKAVEVRDLVDWVSWLSVSGRIGEAIDPLLRGKGDDGEMVEFLKMASCCIVPRPDDRPSMSQVYQSLKRVGARRRDQSELFDEFPLLYRNDNIGDNREAGVAQWHYTEEKSLQPQRRGTVGCEIQQSDLALARSPHAFSLSSSAVGSEIQRLLGAEDGKARRPQR